jgi:DNA-binding SARP family transcriptional activator/class 3 adenylate cyclase
MFHLFATHAATVPTHGCNLVVVRHHVPEAGTVIEIRLLGRFSARRSGEEIPPGAFGSRLVRTLVRVLVTRRGEYVSHDVLAEALWPARLPADPAANLKVLVNRARRALGDPGLILTAPGGYSFAAGDACVVDAESFLAAAESGRQQLAADRAGAALREFRQALDRWSEPLPEDAYEDWAQEYRATLARAHLQVLEEAAAAALAVRDPAQAAALAEQAVARQPLRETAHVLLARALAASGDQAAALRALARLRDRLVEELGIDPSPAARQLEQQILQGEHLGPAVARPAAPTPRAAFSQLPFVGRDAELDVVLDAVSGPSPGTALVAGGPGTGKTRLLSEVAARSELAVLAIRAFLPEREEPWGLARSLLREAVSLDVAAARALPDRAAEALADIVPELEELRPIAVATVDRESRRALALEAGVRVVGAIGAAGALLLIDDLQWADTTSLGLLGLLLSRVPQLGVVLAYRPEEVPADSPVAAFLSDLSTHRAPVASVSPAPLSATAISRLVADESLVEAIVEDSDGTPLAVAEVLHALARQGAVELDLEGRWRRRGDDAPDRARELARSGQRRAIAARAARQPSRRRQVLSLLALVGREVPARIVASAMEIEQAPLLDDLDALSRAGLARLGDGGWAPVHDLVGETVSDGLDPGERGRFHQLLARALAEGRGDPAEIARHLTGAGDRPAAAAAYAEAAQERLERFASDEVVRLADAGLSLDPEPSVRRRCLQARGEGRAIAGDLAGARADLRAALVGVPSGPERAGILARVATLTLAEDVAQAVELAEAALVEARADPATRAEALATAAVVDLNAGSFDRAEDRLAGALTLFEELGDAGGMARVLDARALRAMFLGRFGDAADLFDRAARAYVDAGKLLLAGTPRALRGWSLLQAGRAEDGLRDIEEALDLERMLGQGEGEAICHVFRSEALIRLTRPEEARQAAREAAALSRRVGSREWLACALRCLGEAEDGAGNRQAAEKTLREAVEMSAGMPPVLSLATSSLAAVLIADGDLTGAEQYAREALATGIHAFSQFEARLALAEIALLRNEPDADEMAAEALSRAEAHGFDFRPVHRRLQVFSRLAAQPQRAPAAVERQRRTFMFTDIVRSTNLVEALGDDAWDHLLHWHDETLRSLFASHGGEEVNRIGDGFFVAFDGPKAAAECAKAIQQALARHRNEHGFAPQVRIGLHEAEATRTGNDYQGKGVHMAARIGALAAGGEILASRSAATQLGRLPVSSPRTVKLKGLSEPVDVVSVVWQ